VGSTDVAADTATSPAIDDTWSDAESEQSEARSKKVRRFLRLEWQVSFFVIFALYYNFIYTKLNVCLVNAAGVFTVLFPVSDTQNAFNLIFLL